MDHGDLPKKYTYIDEQNPIEKLKKQRMTNIIQRMLSVEEGEERLSPKKILSLLKKRGQAYRNKS